MARITGKPRREKRRVHTPHNPFVSSLVALAIFSACSAPCIAQQISPNTQNLGELVSNVPNAHAAPDVTGTFRNSELTVVPPDFAELKLAPGFLVALDVLDDPDFEGSFRVDQQGDLALPILGNVHVGGETASEARVQIQQRLVHDGILKSPQVNLTVVEYTAPEVTIIGEVNAPGRYPLLAPRSLTDVLALAGGLTITAGDQIRITHAAANAKTEQIHFSKATSPEAVQDTIVHPGDTVQVLRAGVVYVLGAVGRPGGYVMREDGAMTVLEAISDANGTILSASVGKIYVLRQEPGGAAIRIELPLDKMQRGKFADMQLHPTDIVYVPNSKVKTALTSSQAILASATSASIYATAVY
jgi:polysaccharide biosynthesis/export protein